MCRQAQLVSRSNSIKNSMAQLQISARNSFEINLLVSSDPQSVTLSESDLNKIKVRFG